MPEGTVRAIVAQAGLSMDYLKGRHSIRSLDTANQMGIMASSAVGKRLIYAELIGLPETRQPRIM